MTAIMKMSGVEEGQMQWVWWPYIPNGCVTLLFGPGGVGKSHITLDIAARMSRGMAFPHSTMRTEPSNVLLLSAEDDPAVVIKPRLRAARADMRRIYVAKDVFTLDNKGMKELRSAAEESEAKIVFIDPIVAYLGGKVDMFRANEVRGMIQPLNQMASELDLAVVIVGHERKSKVGPAQDNAMGSADFVNGPRSTLYACEDMYGKAMWHVKTNYAAMGPAISFSFSSEEGQDMVEWGDLREEREPQFGWQGKGTSHGNGDGGEEMGGARDKAEVFLLTLLKDGPVPAKEVEAALADEGKRTGAAMSKRTVDRAKKKLKIESYAKRVEGRLTWYWRLSEQGVE